MMDVLGDVLKVTHEPNDRWTAPKLDKAEQQQVCTKYDQLTSDILNLASDLDIASVGIDVNTKGVTKRILYVAEQWFFGFDYLRHGPLERLLPLCSKEAQANTNKILEDIKVLIRAYGGTTECSRLGGPLVNTKHTCLGGHSVWDFPGGIITKRRMD
ncbi:hypothetical protein CEP54_014745 [Fusarium duplospermum]|uniref:Uncharacterized protein n=1 Tax=Fusarium duplospermum TaxID=1325734 RepID=A0A428NU38_9HYPO|nr:hypothetical protein CEP54_014745 [Fusarium duplospermum]